MTRDGHGYGTGWGGGVGWGGAVSPLNLPVTESETLTLGEGLDVWRPLWVQAALVTNPYGLIVEFSHDLDPAYPPHTNIFNYSISPPLIVAGAFVGPDANQIRLKTGEQAGTNYTLTVGDARALTGDTLDPARDTALFFGFPITPTFYATAQSRTKVLLTFSATLEINAAVTEPSNYTIADIDGTPVTVNSASVNQTQSEPMWVTLELGTSLTPGGYYVCTLSLAIKNNGGSPYSPLSDVFQYIERERQFNVPISVFSGEVSSGILGQPLGQVFFSPALEGLTSTPATSTIQVDSVSVCTRAYDVYEIPEVPDPEPLMTFGAGTAYNSSVLNNADNVLQATADRMGLAHINLSDHPEDTWGGAVDGPCDATLQETFDQSKVALLNVDDWVLYDGVGAPFICADNLAAPIGPGTTTNINLQP